MRRITPALLRRFPLPEPDEDADKNSRGIVLVVGGSTTVPGAILLSGVAALRAGAGKLQFGTPREIAIPLGIAVPEALVASGATMNPLVKAADAVLVGPGMPDRPSSATHAREIMRRMAPGARLVLDATALPAIKTRRAEVPAVITPHTSEMAKLLGVEPDEVERDPEGVAMHAAERFGCVVALKGPVTHIAAGGDCYLYEGGSVGLATSGSGDTLSGIIAGLAARGADTLTATLWGVWAHGAAGRRLSRRVARTGFLARELLDEVPRVLAGR